MAETGTSVVERLRDVELFGELDDAALEQIARRAAEFEVPAGHVLIEPQHEASGMFVITEGTVAVEAPGVHAERGAGECVGEMALLSDHALRSARVRAASPVRGLAIRRDDFWEILEAEPRMALALLRVVGRRLAQ